MLVSPVAAMLGAAALPAAKVCNVLRSLTGVRRARYYEGKWVGAEGLVYEMFTPDRHIKSATATGRIVIGVDDGTRNPFACIRGLLDGDDNLYLSREVYRSGMNEAEKVAAVKSMYDGAEVVVVDPSAAGLIQALQAAGINTIGANNDVLAGIAKVQQRFSDGRLFIDPSCTKLVQELQTYEWADNDKKDVPVKEADHGLDASRYLCMRIDGEGDWGRLLAAQANPAERARPERPRIGEPAPAIAPAFVWPEAESETWSM